MAKPTLLELVQDILSDADGDEVNSVSATVESLQCASIIRDTFRSIVDQHDLQELEEVVQLTATSSATPTLMERPARFHTIKWIKYDKRTTASGDPNYEEVCWLSPADFIERTASRTASESDVETMVLDSGHKLQIKNDKAPSYYTQLQGYDDLLFDSYDKTVDTNLQQSKTLALGTIKPDLLITNLAVIDLPEHLITLLRNEARAFYFDLFKDGVTSEVDRRRRRSEVRAQRKRHIVKEAIDRTGPYYGRK